MTISLKEFKSFSSLEETAFWSSRVKIRAIIAAQTVISKNLLIVRSSRFDSCIIKPARYLPVRYALFLPAQNVLITKMINLYFIQHRKVAGDDVNIKLNTNILQ